MARKKSTRAQMRDWKLEIERYDRQERERALLVWKEGGARLAELIDELGGEIDVEQLDTAMADRLHPDKIRPWLLDALRAEILEIVHRGDDEILRRPLDAKLLELLERKGRRRGLRWQALERLLHCKGGPGQLALSVALQRQATAGRVEWSAGLYRRARPPPLKIPP